MYSCNIVSIDANVGHPVDDVSCCSDTVGECEPVYNDCACGVHRSATLQANGKIVLSPSCHALRAK